MGEDNKNKCIGPKHTANDHKRGNRYLIAYPAVIPYYEIRSLPITERKDADLPEQCQVLTRTVDDRLGHSPRN